MDAMTQQHHELKHQLQKLKDRDAKVAAAAAKALKKAEWEADQHAMKQAYQIAEASDGDGDGDGDLGDVSDDDVWGLEAGETLAKTAPVGSLMDHDHDKVLHRKEGPPRDP
jgi:hypothetical protein